ncbi:MAG: hypothetical protein ACE5KV_08715 [Thermoplasmata archaeon]
MIKSDIEDNSSLSLVDDFPSERCEKCGSRVISTDGVCLFCDSTKHPPKKRSVKRIKSEASQPERLEKITMYLGMILIAAGGPGIALLSYLHDWFRLPFPSPEYDAYEAFGQVNFLVAVVGLIVLTVGIFLLVVSLKAGKGIGREQPEGVSR